jgi:catechol 2,3-dioxygenase-like lactoylglutathione lyase family enzyme
MIIKMNIQKISAVTLNVKDMKKSYAFYSRIPGLKLAYGNPDSLFTSFELTDLTNGSISFINLASSEKNNYKKFGRIILFSEDVDNLHAFFKNDVIISKLIKIENEPKNAEWGERYFHIIDPEGYELSFAQPVKKGQIKS